MWVQGKVGVQQVPGLHMVVMSHLIHVVGRVADLHVDAPVGHGLPLHLLASGKWKHELERDVMGLLESSI